MSKGNGIVKSAVVLTAAGLITRILGFVYRIYMTKAIGAEGMGLYQLIMPLYTLAWSVTCAGVTTTVAKLVAGQNAKKQFGNMGRTVRAAVAITGGLGVITAFIMYFGAGVIGGGFFGDGRTVMSIKILAAAVPFMAVGSAIRGYFTGLSDMRPPAVSQVLEQCVRMAVIFFAAGSMVQRGLEYACAAAVIGILAGEVLACLYVAYRYNTHRVTYAFNHRVPDIDYKTVFTSIAVMALPLTLNRVTGSLLTAVESILIPRSLQVYGMTSGEAIAAFGKITGMAMPLLFFPSVFLMSLSTSIVPAVADASAKGNGERLSGVLSKSFLFTILVGIGAAAVFLAVPSELGFAVYGQDIGQILFMMAFICPLWYLNITINGALNGLGAMGRIFRNNLIGSAINIVSIICLVPKLGVAGFILGWLLGISVQAVLGIAHIRKAASLTFPLVNWLVKPLLAGAASGLVVKLLGSRYIFPNMPTLAGVVISVVLLLSLYAAFIMLLGVMSGKDLFKALKMVSPSKEQA